MFRTARRRLVAWNVAVLGLILLLLGAAVYTLFSAQVYKDVDSRLQAQATSDVSLLDLHGGDVNVIVNEPYVDTADFRTVVSDAGGGVDVTSACPMGDPYFMFHACPKGSMDLVSPAAILSALRTGRDLRTTSFHGLPQRVLTFTVVINGMPRIIQISRSASGEETSLDELRLLLILGALAGMLFTGLGSLFLANRAFVPISQAFRRQRQFTADASHELRTPLALIRANAEMLSRHGSALPPEDDELIGEIIHETDHLNRLVSDLLTLARADSDQVQIARGPVDFSALVADVHDDLLHIAETRGIRSTLSLDSNITVQGDEGRLRQLLLILLDNALKYTDQGGQVDISLRGEDAHARLVVSDTGIGIAPRDIPHIFDRFYRADPARQRETGGTGLGLAIARWIARAHGGDVRAESNLGHGARFIVELPVRSPKDVPLSRAVAS